MIFYANSHHRTFLFLVAASVSIAVVGTAWSPHTLWAADRSGARGPETATETVGTTEVTTAKPPAKETSEAAPKQAMPPTPDNGKNGDPASVEISETPANGSAPGEKSGQPTGRKVNSQGGAKTLGTTPKQAPDAGMSLLKKARELVKEGNHSEALVNFEAALKKAEAKGDQKIVAAALDGMAQVSRELGHDKEALNYLRRSIKIHQDLKNARARGLALLLEARILVGQTKYAEALQSFDESLKILPDSEAAERLRLLEEMAACQVRLNKPSEALATYNRLLSRLTKDGPQQETARILQVIGEMELSRSDYRSGKASFKKAEGIYRKMGLKKELAETLFRSAYLDQMQGDLKAAQSAIEEGRSLLATTADTEGGALPLFVRGINDRNEGRVAQAVQSLSGALHQYEGAGDRLMAVRVRLALGSVENERCRMKSALEHAGKALNEFRVLADPAGEASALHLISTIYFRQGFVQKALEYAQESLAVAKKSSDKNAMTQARILLADIHTSLGDIEFAGKLLKEALEDAAGLNRITRGQMRLAVARFHVAREASDRALQAADAARKDFAELNDRRAMADCDHLMGTIHEMRGDRKNALELFERALKEHRSMWDQYGEGKDLTALGVHYKNLGDHDKALDYFRQALDIRNRIGDRRGHAATLANIGNLLKHRNQIPEALQNLEQALEIYRELSDKKGQADILTNLGNVQQAARSQSAALEKLNSALALHREIHDLRGVSTDLASIARLYLVRGDLESAGKHLEEALKYNKRINNPSGEVAILAEQAMLERAAKNPRKALTLLQEALKLARKIEDSRAISSLYLKTAMVLRDAGNYDKALSLLNETMNMMKQQQDRLGEVWALGEMGIIQVNMEDYESALTNLQKALELRSELGLPPAQSRDLDFYLGEIYEGFKDFEQALDHYHKALGMAQVTGTDSMLGQLHHRIGNIYYQIEEYAKAKESYEDALRVHSETKNIPMQKAELIRLADILSKLGDSEAALKTDLKVLTLTRDTGDKSTEARILTRIGTLYQTLGRPRIALEYYREARDKRTELGEQRGLNENLLQIALVNSILGDFDAAIPDLKRAFEIANCSEDRSMLWKAYFIMGRALQGKNRLGEALESYRKAVTILEAMEADIIEESDEDNFIFGGKTALFETTLTVLMNLARKDREGAYDHQALAIVDKLKAAEFETSLARTNVEGFSDLPPELLVKEKSLRLALRKINDRLTTELSQAKPDRTQVEKLLEERRAKEALFMKLKEQLAKDYTAYSALRYPKPVSVPRLQKEMTDNNEAVLEYMVTRSRTYLFAMDKTRFATYSIDYSVKDLERDVNALLRPLQRADTQESWDPSIAYKIYSQMIQPAEQFLQGKKVVTVIPHGPLCSLPLEILVTSKAHAAKRFWSTSDRPSYLLERYAFSYAPSSSLLSYLRARKRQAKPGWTLVAFGDPIYADEEKKKELNAGAERMSAGVEEISKAARGHRSQPPPISRKEVSEIVKTMGGPVQTYFGAQATESLFKKADLSRYGYIHLAVQSLLLGGPGKLWQQPAVVFSLYGDQENDGFLQLGEIFGLRLNADLVVLSSCLAPGKEQHAGGYGLTGLARAFLFAGADSVVMSLWPVNHESTSRLFLEMYGRLRDGSKAQALRNAKMELLMNRSTSHPYYWGSFVLMGKWGVTYPPGFHRVDPAKMRFQGLSTWRRYLGQ